jgi:hypothetical protein
VQSNRNSLEDHIRITVAMGRNLADIDYAIGITLVLDMRVRTSHSGIAPTIVEVHTIASYDADCHCTESGS